MSQKQFFHEMVDWEEHRARNPHTNYPVRKEMAVDKLLKAYRREHIDARRAIVGVDTVIEIYIPVVWGNYSSASRILEARLDARVAESARILAVTFAATYHLEINFPEPRPSRDGKYVTHLRFEKPLEERTVENRV